MKPKELPKRLKIVTQNLPLAGVAVSALLLQQRIGQQFVMLIVMLWVQAFFFVEFFIAGK